MKLICNCLTLIFLLFLRMNNAGYMFQDQNYLFFSRNCV
jgi:hypothetical protein